MNTKEPRKILEIIGDFHDDRVVQASNAAGRQLCDRLTVDLQFFCGASDQGFSDSIVADGPVAKKSEVIGTMPCAARGHEITWIDDETVLLSGGFNGETMFSTYLIKLPILEANERAAAAQSISWFSAARLGGCFSIIGGFKIPNGYLSSLMSYDILSVTLSMIDGVVSRYIHHQGVFGANALLRVGDQLLSVAGADKLNADSGHAITIGTVTAFDPATLELTQHAKTKASSREDLGSIEIGDEVLLVGGMAGDEDVPSKVIDLFGPRTGDIRVVTELSAGQLTPACGIVGDKLIVAGGVVKPIDGNSDTIEQFEMARS